MEGQQQAREHVKVENLNEVQVGIGWVGVHTDKQTFYKKLISTFGRSQEHFLSSQ